MTETLYIVDIATYGNIIKLFLSKTKNKDIWGDDQNDAPYEHNAGEVYDKFVDATYSIAIDPKYYVTTPEFDYTYGLKQFEFNVCFVQGMQFYALSFYDIFPIWT